MPVDVRPRFKIDEDLIGRALAVLRPADLILFFAERPVSSPVYHAQRIYGFPETVCAISHVGIYVGGGMVVHSQPASSLRDAGGIRQENLVETLFRRTVVGLRYEQFVEEGTEPRLGGSVAAMIASHARAQVGGGYDHVAAANLAVDALRHSFSNRKRRPQAVNRYIDTVTYSDPRREAAKISNNFICSDLVYNCYDWVLTKMNPMNLPQLMRAPNRLPVEFFLNPRFLSINFASVGPTVLPAEFGPLSFGGGGAGGPVVRLF